MAQLHTIRRRIKSVKSIRQITKAMELVAASKLRRAQEAALASRLYAQSAREVLTTLRAAGSLTADPLFAERAVRHHTLVLFSSDRGLAGAYTVNLVRTVLEWLAARPEQTVEAIVVGQMIRQ